MDDVFGNESLFSVFEGKSSKSNTITSAKRPRDDDSADSRASKKPSTQRMLGPDSILVRPMPTPVFPPAKSEEEQFIQDRKACQHEMCVPPNWTEETPAMESVNGIKEPARKYPFELDPFQKVATACIDQRHSVLVSAHTSAGKTVVAEYAIALALREKQRVIYTSPIKALSNQKYRELYEDFQDVGLMTGDITINPSASCLVMTTEILRSMLYRGSEILREIGWVVFDEIHYMRDKERGVVWEETIILLPDTIRFVFLSATIPNAREFASWIAHIHNQPCHVVYTDYRPTPLQHYIFPSGGNGLYLVVDEKGTFKEDNFQAALSALAPEPSSRGKLGKKKPVKGGGDIYKIIKMIMERNYEPVIVFAFSKKQCEQCALSLAKLDFNNETEKELVQTVFNNAIDTLNEEDKKLPQIAQLLPLLKQGIGVHHSGLLPLLKEVIEILFQEGLVKCLFATETFSMGLNMPAKTVVFTSVRKFDGKDFRWVSGGEYIQMSGRAGRRGLDDRGIVIMMVDEKMEPQVAQGMVKGQSDVLYSQFHIGYNMLLNLLRVEGMDPVYMLRQSFHQFQNDRELPLLRDKLKKLEEERHRILITNESLVLEYYQLRKQISKDKEEIRKIINQPLHALPFLQMGRLVRVKDGDTDWGWGVIVNFQKRTNNKKTDAYEITIGDTVQYIVDVLLPCAPSENKNEPPRPAPPGIVPEMQVIPVMLNILDGISSVRVFVPKDLITPESRQVVSNNINEIMKRFPHGIPLLDPIEDIKIEDATFTKIVRKIETLEAQIKDSKFTSPDLISNYQKLLTKKSIESEIRKVKKKLNETDNVILHDELKGMKRVLRRLGFMTKDNVIDVKGRIAADLNSSDELVITEMLFSGFFTELTVNQIPAIMSCFVFDEKTNTTPGKLAQELRDSLQQVQDLARRVATISKESKLNVDVEEYVAKFKPDMMDIVYAWCNGATFKEICEMTDIFEGSIIRSMRRLEELLRQLVSAAKAIGNSELEAKIAEGITKLKRDIVFAASLYL